MTIIPLVINELNEECRYEKKLESTKTHAGKILCDDQGNPLVFSCTIKLRHAKTDCMYPHCVFQFFYDGSEMTKDNYNKTLGKHSKLQTMAKEEICKMIAWGEVRINWPKEEM